jgi:hypothetical protein
MLAVEAVADRAILVVVLQDQVAQAVAVLVVQICKQELLVQLI